MVAFDPSDFDSHKDAMEKIIEFVRRFIASKFTGKVTLHFHLGVIKKVTREEEVKYNIIRN